MFYPLELLEEEGVHVICVNQRLIPNSTSDQLRSIEPYLILAYNTIPGIVTYHSVMAPVTPTSQRRLFQPASDLNLGASNVRMPYGNDSPRRGIEEHFDAMLPRVLAASRRLQNATDVRNEDAWPTPSKRAVEIDQLTYTVNVAILEHAIHTCGKFYVDMNRESARGEILDNAVKGLEKRKIKVAIKTKNEDTGATVAEQAQGNKKKKRLNKGKEIAITNVKGQDVTGDSMQAKNGPAQSGVNPEVGTKVLPVC